VIATRNKGKEREMRMVLSGLDIEVLSLNDLPDVREVLEDGATLEENAMKKARQVAREGGLPSLADDTGLEVFALRMEPGVRSARYAGENVSYDDNNMKLLAEMNGMAPGERHARFRCVVVFVGDGKEKVIEGICNGMIAEEKRGTEGFGYDPIFIPDGFDRSFAQLTADEKNRISHRGKAMREMRAYLESIIRS
jgi:XTP/dITP diphosphohydrolase